MQFLIETVGMFKKHLFCRKYEGIKPKLYSFNQTNHFYSNLKGDRYSSEIEPHKHLLGWKREKKGNICRLSQI